MFVGHYGVSFVAKRYDPSLPLWLLFLAVQLLDVLWAPFVLLGIEKVRIVPGITRSNPLDLYYMPYTHSLVAALLWSLGAAVLYKLVAAGGRRRSAFLLGLAVFSHWLLDLVVHRPDLPLYDDAAKVGLGLWNLPAIAFGLEALLLLGGIALCLQQGLLKTRASLVFGVAMLAIHAQVFFGAPPASANAAALTALAAYFAFAGVIHFVEARASASSGATARA
jgi:hypothetical protein